MFSFQQNFNYFLRRLKLLFYHRSIKEEIFYPLILLFVLGFSVSVAILYFGGNYFIEKLALDKLTAEKIRFLNAINEKRRMLEQIVILISHNEKVKEYIYHKDKQALDKYAIFLLNELREKEENYSFSLGFFLYPLESFLNVKGTEPQKGNIPQIVTTVSKTHTFLSGIEVSPTGVKLRAVAPVSKVSSNGEIEWIGLVEAVIDFKEVVKKYPFTENEGIITLLTPNVQKAILEKGEVNQQGSYITTLYFPSSFYSKFKKEVNKNNKDIIREGNYLFLSFPLFDFQGEKIAQVFLVKNLYSLIHKRNYILLILSFMFFSAFVVTGLIIWGGLNHIVKKIAGLEESIASVLRGDFSKPLPISYKLQCWEILGCTNKACPVYGRRDKICFMVTGDLALASPYRGSCVFLSKYGTCQSCPVMQRRTRNEINGLICWYDNLFEILSNFFHKVNAKLSEMLNNPREEPGESLILRVERIVNELVEMTRFREILETFGDKEEIYEYLKWFLKAHFGIKNFLIYEVNNSENRFELMVNESQEIQNKIFPDLLIDCNLCPVKRNSEALSSLDYPYVCSYAYIDLDRYFHYCLPIMMGERVGAVLKIIEKKEHQEEFLHKIPFIQKYLEEVAPILEAKRAIAVARQQALRDQLTGLYNRRFMDEYLNKWNLFLKRQQGKAAVLMLDLDHFKKINDTYGHQTGDLVLKKLAHVLVRNLRASDLVFRYGGEEILVFLPEVSKKDAIKVAEKLRRAVEMTEFETLDKKKIRITVSIGVAAYPEDSDDLNKVIRLADKALYMAKQQGRNRVIAYNTSLKLNS